LTNHQHTAFQEAILASLLPRIQAANAHLNNSEKDMPQNEEKDALKVEKPELALATVQPF
jgi:hypothetical protein